MATTIYEREIGVGISAFLLFSLSELDLNTLIDIAHSFLISERSLLISLLIKKVTCLNHFSFSCALNELFHLHY